jgi:hypothetical protein
MTGRQTLFLVHLAELAYDKMGAKRAAEWFDEPNETLIWGDTLEWHAPHEAFPNDGWEPEDIRPRLVLQVVEEM